MAVLIDLILKRWLIFAFITSAAMLAIAHGFEIFGHLPPCHLCLKQREVYWVALAVSAVTIVLSATPLDGRARRLGALTLALIFAYGAYLAGFHAGAEWHWWPAPEGCASTGVRVTSKDLNALLNGGGAHMPACDVAPWVFLGLSMAGWNFLISLKLVVWSFLSALSPTRPS